VAGVSGVGKSTLCRRIADATALPYTEIDALYHGPGWVPLPTFEADVLAFSAASEWVTEWQYSSVRSVLAARAELLVWLDYPASVALWRVATRTIRRSRAREVLWNGNVEPGLLNALFAKEGIIRWVLTTRSKYPKRVPEAVRDNPGLELVRLRSQRETDAWVASLRKLRS